MQVLLEGLSADAAERAARLPQEVRPPTARLPGLPGEPVVVWRPDLDSLASPFLRDIQWARVGDIARSAGWGPFATMGFLVSGSDALTPLHYDKHHNIFLQLHGAKRFLLFEASESPNLYGFPTLHALDPLSRVDLEADEDEMLARWPRLAKAHGAEVTLEAGDALVLPQGTWHHVHSLASTNVSANLLFSLGDGEACGGGGLHVKVGSLPPARQPAALAELAKTFEGFAASLVGSGQAAAALLAARGAALAGTPAPEWSAEATALRAFLIDRLGDGADGALAMSPEDFLREYLDPGRFADLPLRAGPG